VSGAGAAASAGLVGEPADERQAGQLPSGASLGNGLSQIGQVRFSGIGFRWVTKTHYITQQDSQALNTDRLPAFLPGSRQDLSVRL
jgi:hypothetical protein